jgi:hypothetical protein
MNTAEIAHAMSSNRITSSLFRGVFACDEVPPSMALPAAIIVNTDTTQEPGAHWIAFYQEREGEVEYFDSYGKPLTFYGPKVEVLGKDKRVISQAHQLQSNLTTVCGQYCMFFLLRRCSGESFAHIVHLFTASQTSNDTMVCQYVNFHFDMNTKIVDKRFIRQIAKQLN